MMNIRIQQNSEEKQENHIFLLASLEQQQAEDWNGLVLLDQLDQCSPPLSATGPLLP